MATATRVPRALSREATLANQRLFGWDLPPGCTLRHIEEAYGDEGPCECCGHDPADCICPECPECHEVGNEDCYQLGHLKFSREQMIGKARMRIEDLRFRIQEEEQNIKYFKEGGDIE
jgi:hypothetical protein